jgi:GH18 family chitinase
MNSLVERKIGIDMLAYCDYIAKVISEAMKKDADRYSSYIDNVGKTHWDLDASTGAFLSTRKTISVIDKNGKAYRVTIEEVK